MSIFFRIFIFLIIISFGSCKKFVDIDLPKDLISREKTFNDDLTASSAVKGMYVSLRNSSAFSGGSAEGLVICTGLSSDELVYVQQNLIDIQFQNNEILPENGRVLTLWQSMYQSIYQANAIIEGVSSSVKMSSAAKIHFEAEARFVRAFCYFYLVNTFGDAPLIITTDYERNALVSRTSKEKVYDQIIEDLIFSKNNLDIIYVNGERIRANKFVVSAFLARVYLYLGNWTKAEEESSLVIDNTSLFSLASINDVFLKNSMETIWQIQPAINGAGEGIPAEAQIFADANIRNSYFIREGFESDFEDGDSRLSSWIAGPPSGYYPAKYKQLLGSQITEYSMVLRLAEQFLIRAEARVHLNNISGSQDDINVIRDRAGLSATTASDLSTLLTAIEQERKHEFFIEWGHRWYDLKRWNKLSEFLSLPDKNWNINDTIYPIPQDEINKNPNLTPQNPNY